MRPFSCSFFPRVSRSIVLPLSILLLIFAVAAITVHRRATQRLVAQKDQRWANAASAAISRELFRRQAIVRALALSLKDGVSPARVVEEARPFTGDFSEGLAVISGKGRIVAGSFPSPARPVTLVRGLGSSESCPEKFSPTITEEGAIVLSSGGAPGVVGAFTIRELLRTALPSLESRVMSDDVIILDPGSGVLAYAGTPPLDGVSAIDSMIRKALRDVPGYLLASSPIPSTGWVLLDVETWARVASPVLQATLVAPLALALALAFSLMGLWFVSRHVVAPIRSLLSQSQRTTAGDLAAASQNVGGVQEIQALQQCMAAMARRVQLTQLSLRRYIGRMTSAQEEENQRLAQDLHDETIQDLIAIDRKVVLAAIHLRGGEGVQTCDLEAIHRRATLAIERVRRLSRALRPECLAELGLLPALEALASDVETEAGILIAMQTYGSPRQLSSEVDLALYRIVQEALTNLVRHAAARRGWIILRYRRQELWMCVKDDGESCAAPASRAELSRKGHFGIIGMRDRARSIGARIEWHSFSGRRTAVVLRLPLS